MPKQTAQKLSNQYKTNCPFEIAHDKGIIVLFEALGGALGYYNRYKRIQIIHINNEIDQTQQRFVCAHELGHAILHPSANTPFLKRNTYIVTDRLEREANTFAVELLMPDETLYDYKDTNTTIYEAATEYGIPPELAHLKIMDSKIFYR